MINWVCCVKIICIENGVGGYRGGYSEFLVN